MDWKLFFSTFGLVFVAELPDKTALATLILASRGRAKPIFVGVACAFAVQSAVAVAFGSVLGKLPHAWVHLGAGLLFFAFAVASLRRESPEHCQDGNATRCKEPESHFRIDQELSARGFLREAWVAFGVIFIAEWGDLTQLATASLSARFAAPLTVFVAATSSLWLMTVVAIAAGRSVARVMKPATLNRLAALVFACVGVWLLIDSLRSLAVRH